MYKALTEFIVKYVIFFQPLIYCGSEKVTVQHK